MLRHFARYLSYIVGGASAVPDALRLDQAWWEDDYRRGGLDRIEGDAELARHLVVAGFVRHYAPGAAVLDIGCGTGAGIAPLRAVLAGLPSRYVGLDYSELALEVAGARARESDGRGQPPLGDVRFVRGDFDQYEPGERFDAVIFSESLYYAPNPLRTIRRYTAVLNEGGVVIVSMWRRPSRARVWRTLGTELAERNRARLVVPRRPAWDIVVYGRAGA